VQETWNQCKRCNKKIK